MLAADQLGQIFALLLVVRPAADLVDAEVGVGAVAEADRGRGARHFLLRDDMLEIAEAEPAPFLLDGDAVQAELAHLRPQLRAGIRPSRRSRRRSARSCRAAKRSRRVADGVGHFAEVEVEAGVGHIVLSCRPAALAEREAFEQAAAQPYVHCNNSHSGAIRHGHHRLPIPTVILSYRPHPDGRDAGRACRRLGDRPRRDRGQGRGRARRRLAATTSTASTWAACFPPASARPRPARRRSRPACPSRSRRPRSTRSAARACRR